MSSLPESQARLVAPRPLVPLEALGCPPVRSENGPGGDDRSESCVVVMDGRRR